jgi:hypothetical protein
MGETVQVTESDATFMTFVSRRGRTREGVRRANGAVVALVLAVGDSYLLRAIPNVPHGHGSLCLLYQAGDRTRVTRMRALQPAIRATRGHRG